MLDRTLPPESFAFPTPRLYPMGVERLPNGIPLYMLHQSDRELIRMDVRVCAGSRFQSKQGNALAVSKMLQEGTLKHPGESWADCLDYEGAFLEVDNGRDFTVFSFYFLYKSKDRVLELAQEMFQCPAFRPEHLDLVRFQQKQNLQVSLEKNSNLAYRSFFSAVFGEEHPYGRFLWPEQTDDWTVEDVRDHFEKHYVPEAIRIFVAGNITDELKNQLSQTMGKLSGAAFGGRFPSNVEYSVSQFHFQERPQSMQSSICMGKILFQRTHPDWYPMMLVNRVLGGYFGSRLMTQIREKSGLAYGIYSYLAPMQHAGVFCISADVDASRTDEALKKIRIEVSELCDKGTDMEELSRVCAYESGILLRSFDGLFSLMDRYMGLDDYGLAVSSFEDYFRCISEITPEKIRSLAEQWLQPETFTVGVVGKCSGPSAWE